MSAMQKMISCFVHIGLAITLVLFCGKTHLVSRHTAGRPGSAVHDVPAPVSNLAQPK